MVTALRIDGSAIHIGAGVLRDVGTIVRDAAPSHTVAIVTDNQVARTPAFERVHGACSDAARHVVWHAIPAGETHKTRETWSLVTDALLSAGCGRDTTIVALGGGVVGDLAGFVAATYMRGVPVVQVPTSLLAMVDASIGGKTGVDTSHGKNLVGAFHLPAAVVIDPEALATLPVQHVRAGMAEVLKHGAIADAAYFTRAAAFAERCHGLLGDATPSRRDATLWSTEEAVALVARSVEIKSAITAADPHEAGERAVLNAGHTVAHALEQVTGYALLHGEAVSIGLVAEATLGEQLGVTAAGTAEALRDALGGAGLPTDLPQGAAAADVVAAARYDKKNRRGGLRLPLLASIGKMAGSYGQWSMEVDSATLEQTLRSLFRSR